MPYPNFHAARIKSPDAFARIVVLKTLDNGIMIYGGPLKSDPSGPSKTQAVRFPKSRFTAAQARAWLRENDYTVILFEPASGGEANASALIHEGQYAISVGGKIEAAGEDPIQRFKKDMIKVGVYIHPTLGWTMDVTEQRMRTWVAAFNKMREKGVDVEIPTKHAGDSTDNLGYITDMFVEPDESGIQTLWGIHEIRGQDAIDIVKRNRNVSVWVDRDYVDGKGNHYGEAIRHSCVTLQPVVPGQKDFVPIAASRQADSDKQIPYLWLSSKTKGTIMEKEMLEKLRELLGAGEDLTEENVLGRIEEKITGLTTEKDELQKTNITLTGKVATLEAATKKSASMSKIQKDPDLLEQMASTAEQQLDLLVKDGKIVPAVKDKLHAILIGETNKRNVFALSLQEGNQSVFTGVITALKENDLVKLGEQTGAQVLQRQVPDDKHDTDTKLTDEGKKEGGKMLAQGAGVPEEKDKDKK